MIAFYIAFGIFILIDGKFFYWVSEPKLHLLSSIVFVYAVFKALRLYRKFKEEQNVDSEQEK
ncbi:MAG TPA: hypothetical protein VNG53_09180 [Bacteroidia bacterium]|nr:hypothetical protein [Bacteroidia bacterium]